MNQYSPDKTVRDDYTGEMKEPFEDRSIIQPDGSRACYNWECAEGFSMEGTPVKFTDTNLNCLTTLFLEGKISKVELEGILALSLILIQK